METKTHKVLEQLENQWGEKNKKVTQNVVNKITKLKELERFFIFVKSYHVRYKIMDCYVTL